MKKKKRRSYTGTVLFSALLSASVAALTLYLGAHARPEAHELPGQGGAGSALSLWSESAPFEAEAETPQAVPIESGEEAFAYDELLAKEEGLHIYRIHGKDYRGVLAVVDDPRRLYVATLDYYGEYGLTLEQFIEKNNAVLATNGGGFYDPNGEGNGGMPTGIVMVDGQYRYGGKWGEYDCLALTDEGELITGRRTGEYLESRNTRYAVSYGPALIVDGAVEELYISQPEPRTAVGQRENGETLLLIVEGRQVGALGVDLPTLARIMAELGCINATNLDGGASSALFYRGTLMNRPNGLAGMRPMPSALLMNAIGEVEE